MSLMRWTAAILLAGFLIFLALPAVTGPHPFTAWLEWRTGWGPFEPLIRMTAGIAALIAAALLILPGVKQAGAWLALLLFAAAASAHLTPVMGLHGPVAFAPGANPPFDASTDYVLSAWSFYFALAGLIGALAVIALEFADRED